LRFLTNLLCSLEVRLDVGSTFNILSFGWPNKDRLAGMVIPGLSEKVGRYVVCIRAVEPSAGVLGQSIRPRITLLALVIV